MISAILYDKKQKELNELTSCVKDALAMNTDSDSRVFACEDEDRFDSVVDELDLTDVNCVAFEEDSGQEVIKRFRDKFPSESLMLIVDETLSPRQYIRPGILSSSILIRPYSKDEMTQTVGEFVLECIKDKTVSNDDMFVIEAKDGITNVPYESISYFEAASKKVSVRLKKEEYGFYDTLDDLSERLPDHFIRCHRSYIVNKHKIRQYSTSDNMLILDEDLMIPVSRSYRTSVREMLK